MALRRRHKQQLRAARELDHLGLLERRATSQFLRPQSLPKGPSRHLQTPARVESCVWHRNERRARPGVEQLPHPGVGPVRQQEQLLGVPPTSQPSAGPDSGQPPRSQAEAQQRVGREMERPALDPYNAEQRCAQRGKQERAYVPGNVTPHDGEHRGAREQQARDEQHEEVDDAENRDAARIQAQPIDAVDPPLEIEDAPVGADLGHEPNSEETVSRRRLTPVGVASSTDTIPTANTAAASLKSRRKASTVAATANARPIKLIATARPVSPARAAADSSDEPPRDVGAALAGAAVVRDELDTAAIAWGTGKSQTAAARSTRAAT